MRRGGLWRRVWIWRARTEGAADAEDRGEERVQLRFRGRYIYRIEGAGDGWRLDVLSLRELLTAMRRSRRAG